LDGPGVFRGRTHGILGSTDTTAQVHPYHFTKALIEEAQKTRELSLLLLLKIKGRGFYSFTQTIQTEKAKVRIAKVVSIAYKEGTDTIVGVNVSGSLLFYLFVDEY